MSWPTFKITSATKHVFMWLSRNWKWPFKWQACLLSSSSHVSSLKCKAKYINASLTLIIIFHKFEGDILSLYNSIRIPHWKSLHNQVLWVSPHISWNPIEAKALGHQNKLTLVCLIVVSLHSFISWRLSNFLVFHWIWFRLYFSTKAENFKSHQISNQKIF